MSIKKVSALILASIIMLMSLSGCDKNSKKDGVDSVTLNVATSFGVADSKNSTYKAMLKEFQAINQNIQIADKSAKADDAWKNAIRNQFSGNEEPDVLYFFNKADVKEIIAQDKVVSIEEIRKEYPNYAKNIKPDVMETLVEYDGNNYCVPLVGFWEGLFCNKEIFDQYNIPMVTDWESFIYAIETLKANGVTPIAASLTDVPNYWIEHSILLKGGVDKHSVNPRSPEEVPPEWAEGLNEIVKLYEMGAFQSDTLSTKHDLSVQMFNEGKAAMILDGSWMQVNNSIVDKINVVAFPYDDTVQPENRGTIAGFTMGYYISRKAWNDPTKRDACVKFVEYMTTNDSIARMCTAGSPAVDIEIAEDTNPLIQQGFLLSQKYQVEMPIDSRLTTSAWEYLTIRIPTLIKKEDTAESILENMTKYNE